MNRKNLRTKVLRRGVSRAFAFAPLVFLAVAGAGCPSLFESSTQRAIHVRQAVVGRDGAHTVAGNETVNRYAQLAGTADPVAGDTSITVADVNGNFSAAVAQGDLLLIIQMAGATISTTNDAAYGAFTTTSLGNAGRYEFVGVEGRTGNTITLACGLKNGYTRGGKTQVIRVPQYTTLTIPAGTSIIAPLWNGVTGGVVAVHAETTLDLAGTIDVTARGFRGGQAVNSSTSDPLGITSYFSSSADPTAKDGAEKGEGIAGYEGDLTGGFYGRGAPANGGGGGDAHNAGGGGGANAGDITAWNGKGVMQQCATGQAWRAAWLLEGTGCATSQGGGRGGYSYNWSTAFRDPMTVAPGDTLWGGDNRREVGGVGGRPVPNDPNSRLFLGGGGGAGDGNNNAPGRGGRGGGLVFVIAGTVTGSGSISAKGENGGNAVFSSGGGDGPGGGGGGGTVVVHATSLASTVVINVDGGNGGNQQGSSNDNEVEGPGGGGGGGYIAVAGGTPSMSAAGGPAGTTDRSSMSTFPVDGATAGNAGLTTGSASTFLYCATNVGLLTTIATKPPEFSNVATGSFTFTNTQTPVTYQCKIDNGNFVPCNASYTTPALNDGQHTISVQATNVAGTTEAPPVTYTWTIDTVAPVTTIATHPANPSPSPTGSFTFTNTESPVTYDCKLDGAATWTPCNAAAPTTPSFTTPPLGDGTHTLTVRSTDQAGNIEQTPPTYTWTIEAAALDGGVDGSPAVDSGIDGAPVFLDAEAVDQSVDVGVNDDVAANKDVAGPDLPSDAVVIVNPDVIGPQPGLDGAVDQQPGLDLLPAFDAQAVDSNADLIANGDAADTRPGPDAVVVAEPNRDAAVVPVGDDAAVTKKDAAAGPDDIKVLGSGFCAVAAPGAGSHSTLALVGLAFAMLLFRRRRS